ncbi:general secretion pathway protein GspC [Marinobacter sp. NP-4(2019)]|uniref:type II secretion system protein N n=1 Tax=Marinobacter sp. NP-4(2019) TaxID=2488665 RepID=UPI000FC3E51A|nr:type II secretion system protein N [Marinobacter sp. NP-4(2019)]AZT83782.1 general secretion pathway protein GspC [Marinobacter sp. NP-4(2019)]
MSFNNTRLPMLLALAAVVAMIALTSWQAYRFWQQESQRGNQQLRTAAEMKAVSDEQQVPEVTLASLDLFGEAGESTENQQIDTENLPETNLRLFLRGVLAADGDFPGSALIEDEKNQTEAYLVGDELPGDAKLRSVHANRVIIERGGKLENLYFPESEDQTGLEFAADSSTTPETRGSEPADSPTRATPSPAADDQRREEIRRRLEQLRERLRNNNS